MTTAAAPSATDPRLLVDEIIPPGGHWGRRMARGEVLRIVDLEGRQAVDFLCYDAQRPEERYNAADTMKVAGTIFIGEGTRLLSDMGETLMTVIADTCGRHDTIGGCCSKESNRLRYGVDDTPNCRDNFLAALAPFGLGKRDVVANVNFFMNVPVHPDGTMAIADGLSKPGDHVDLHAETDVIAVLSNCPQTRNPCNGYNPTPIRVMVWSAGGRGVRVGDGEGLV